MISLVSVIFSLLDVNPSHMQKKCWLVFFLSHGYSKLKGIATLLCAGLQFGFTFPHLSGSLCLRLFVKNWWLVGFFLAVSFY